MERKPRVLLVDDEPIVLRGVQRLLRDICHIETNFDIIVTDYDMPDRNGVWLLDYVKNQFPKMQRIMLTGSDPSIFTMHLQSGLIQQYLPKPATANELLTLFN